LNPESFKKIVFFTGAGMSAECGVPTYRGQGGIWHKYKWEEYACQQAFERDPEKVLRFHELRRRSVLQCQPHAGHFTITTLQKRHENVNIVTQNIDGMHQRAGSLNVVELHGSLWHLRCPQHGVIEDIGVHFHSYRCQTCGAWLRPHIIWFGDMLERTVIDAALDLIRQCDLFISVGTSGVVWPAAGFPEIAKEYGAYCIEINPEETEKSHLYEKTLRASASEALPRLFDFKLDEFSADIP
jgi:NAD-dependent deacetylase